MGRVIDSFRAAKFQLTLCATEPVRLPPLAGSTLRGGFGRAFRAIGCAASALGATTCALGERCPYHYVFETLVPPGSAILGTVPTAPRPFVLQPPVAPPAVYETGERISVGLVLIGRAIDYLPYFVDAFDHLGRIGVGRGRGRFHLERVTTLAGDGTERTVYDGARRQLEAEATPLGAYDAPSLPGGTALTVEFLTPTRLRHDGRGAAPEAFHVLFRNVLRRVNFLNYFHCGGELLNDASDLIETASAIETMETRLTYHTWERYSARQDQRVPMGGFTGSATYGGDLAPFWPWLALGEWVHVGKGATFGLGRYRISGASRRANRSEGNTRAETDQ